MVTVNPIIMNPYLEALQPKLSAADFKKLSAINNPNVHEFIAKENDLCHPKDIFICSDSAEDITHIRKQAIASGEEQAILTLQGQTVHFDGEHDQGTRPPSHQVPCTKRSYLKQSPQPNGPTRRFS